MSTQSETKVFKPFDWKAYRSTSDQLEAVVGQIIGVPDMPYDEQQFLARYEQINAFNCPMTSFSPMCLRALYTLGAARQPRRIVGLGTGWCIAMAALCSGAADALGHPVDAVAVDCSPEASAIASTNIRSMKPGIGMNCTIAEAGHWMSSCSAPSSIDVLMIDVDCPEQGKRAYADLLEQAIPRLSPGAIVLAHDASVEQFTHDLERLREVVRNAPSLEGPWDLPVGAGWTLARAVH